MSSNKSKRKRRAARLRELNRERQRMKNEEEKALLDPRDAVGKHYNLPVLLKRWPT